MNFENLEFFKFARANEAKGTLIIVIPDNCINYAPETGPVVERSLERGNIYPCRNFSQIPSGAEHCMACYNWQNPDGKYLHEKERIRDGIK